MRIGNSDVYRGTVLQPEGDYPGEGDTLDQSGQTASGSSPTSSADGFCQIDDVIVVVRGGEIVDFRQVGEMSDVASYTGHGLSKCGGRLFYEGQLVGHGYDVILPPTANCHDHAFQPPGIPGELIRDVQGGPPVGWLPDTLRIGEVVAKRDIDKAAKMAGERMRQFALNGVGAVLEYTTSSVLAAQEIFNAGRDRGVRTFAGYVCMDQGIDPIQPGLQTDSHDAIVCTTQLLKTYDDERVVVIDRFPIVVSSETRRKLAALAREYDTLYETHVDESAGEIDLHKRLYGGRSIIQVLIDDGVFEDNTRVGLAHAIHTQEREMDMIGNRIAKRGCDVSIRACPSSNAMLGSHWRDGRYVRFPYQEWEKRGARITLGTDQGAGRNTSLFAEMLYERGRHPSDLQPSPTTLLKWGILNGYKSLGVGPEDLRIATSRKANFVVVQMAGGGGFYDLDSHHGDIQKTAARVIEGGQHAENILASYIGGKRVK